MLDRDPISPEQLASDTLRDYESHWHEMRCHVDRISFAPISGRTDGCWNEESIDYLDCNFKEKVDIMLKKRRFSKKKSW